MADDSKVVIETLQSHFVQLKAQISYLGGECNRLQDLVNQLQTQVATRDAKIDELTNELAQSEVRYKNLQISQKTELNKQQLQENKERFARLVREIDKCISLLNE